MEGWVLFDRSCGLCRKLARLGSSLLLRRGFILEPLQSPWVGAYLGMSNQELLSDVRFLSFDGRHLQGADVYRVIMRRIWWAAPFACLSVLPGLRRLFDLGYQTIARNRTCDPGVGRRKNVRADEVSSML
ncbi:MAG TPA: DCC1-like thiol-disulfide oxidoreductase family protein [Bacteroidota bacterium]|nr:DCC1-like thiol-disulfide oxidoreductase family protein [Bacteroidota bacterium]